MLSGMELPVPEAVHWVLTGIPTPGSRPVEFRAWLPKDLPFQVE